MKEQTIYLVIEQGAGITHSAYTLKEYAEKEANQKNIESGFSCFEVHPLTLYTPQFTIEELEKNGTLKEAF